jgi:hypothetical protein
MNALVTLWNVISNLAGTLTRTNEIFTEFNARAERSLGMDKEETVLLIEHVEPTKRGKK